MFFISIPSNQELIQGNQQMDIVGTGEEADTLEEIESSSYLTEEFKGSRVLMKNAASWRRLSRGSIFS